MLGLSDSVLAKHIKDLEKMGILQTKMDPSDRRKKI
ncbi:winged helix DNA-binding protein [Ferroglobus placidus]